MEYRDLPRGQDDGLPIADVGGWVREKYLRVWMYDQMFATGMKKRWDERVYVDLFSGSGYSRVRGTNEILMGSPLLAVQIPDRFDRYVFCDENPELLDALRARVERIDALSAHADSDEILRWLRGFTRPPRATYLVHGEPEGSTALAAAIRSRYGWNVEVAKDGETVAL